MEPWSRGAASSLFWARQASVTRRFLQTPPACACVRCDMSDMGRCGSAHLRALHPRRVGRGMRRGCGVVVGVGVSLGACPAAYLLVSFFILLSCTCIDERIRRAKSRAEVIRVRYSSWTSLTLLLLALVCLGLSDTVNVNELPHKHIVDSSS